MIFPLLFSGNNDKKKTNLKKHVVKSLKKEDRKYNSMIEMYEKFTEEMIKVSIVMEEKWKEELNSILKYYSNGKKGKSRNPRNQYQNADQLVQLFQHQGQEI
jgi:dsDNA-binding SOS-regulon protein